MQERSSPIQAVGGIAITLKLDFDELLLLYVFVGKHPWFLCVIVLVEQTTLAGIAMIALKRNY